MKTLLVGTSAATCLEFALWRRRFAIGFIPTRVLPGKPVVLVAALLCCGWPQATAAAPPDACSYLTRAVDRQPAGPGFLPSYPTARIPALKGTAYLYDNAVAAIALVGCGERKRAAHIADAMMAALTRDRYWHDGRLRNAYAAGALGSGPVQLPGYWDNRLGRWVEDGYQVGSDSGNMAWSILALLALDQPGGERRYRDAAVRIGDWVAQWQSSRGAGGFTGGTLGEEPHPQIANWKSTEHNADLAAAFLGLAGSTGYRKWTIRARAADSFVRAMWNSNCRCFDAGTVEDGKTHNRTLALDAQTLPLLAPGGAFKNYSAVIGTLERETRVGGGFAFGNAKGGIWTEGTEQAALLMALSGQESESRALSAAVQKLRASDGGYFATNVGQLPTGLPLNTDQSQSRQYFHLEHLAPVAWAALVERRFNPFTRENRLP
ncbi:MAG TPA: hypothetical protein VKR31_16370 [Rhizomicrobium sp.]|nr:hypothetical protein [Rhizomicrobium sp.]